YNGYPLRVGEMTLGDHLRPLGMGCWLVGKTHMRADKAGMERLGLSPDSVIGARQAECGFDIWVRDDGLWSEGPGGRYDPAESPYEAYLKARGYEGETPWADFANAALEDGKTASGWFLQNAGKPANIREEDSETPWLTGEAISFIEQAETPWCVHLSYIKPHWPYIVPAPYHAMFGPNQVLAANRSEAERVDPHPVYGEFMQTPVARAFSKEDVRTKVIATYMGLIKQADDQMGRLFTFLEETGRMDDTMIVITSDHGDYLGDHWLGEKDLFYEPSVKVPLIIYDPSEAADRTRGTTCDELVEAIDLAPTFIEIAGGTVPDHIIEGRSLLPLLHGQIPGQWREYAISEYDFSTSPICEKLGLAPRDARLFMVADKNWKFMHAEDGFRPMLFDLLNDPDELHDLGASADHGAVIALMQRRLADWSRRMSQRGTMSDAQILRNRGNATAKGILLGAESPGDADPKVAAFYEGKRRKNWRDTT
ncbi:MAG TPA: phosphonate monoester hydrolase, partial [Rhodobacteraceae bacterium]|nr:phosphonate monoester hydrolase [Paracoccaceae bacterium]